MEIAILIFKVLGYALLVLLGLIVLILLTPLRMRFEGGRETELGWLRAYAGIPLRILGVGGVLREGASAYTVYLFGIPVWRRPVPFGKLFSGKGKGTKGGEGDESGRRRKKKDEEKTAHEEKEPFAFSDFVYLLHAPHVRSLIGRLLGLLNLRGELVGEVGFDDPSDTGTLAGVLGFVRWVAPGVGQDIRLDFTEPMFRGRFLVGLTVWLPQIIVGAIVIALGRDGRQLIAHLWGLRKRRLQRVATP